VLSLLRARVEAEVVFLCCARVAEAEVAFF